MKLRPTIPNFPFREDRSVSPLASAAAIFVLALILLSGAGFAWAQNYDGRIGPNVYIGDIDASGMDRETAREAVQARVDAMLTEGIELSVDGETAALPLATLVTADVIEYAEFDIDAAIAAAERAGRHANPLIDAARLAGSGLGWADAHVITVPVELHEDALGETVREIYPDLETEVADAGFDISYGASGWEIGITDAKAGKTFDLEPFYGRLADRLARLDASPIALSLSRKQPEVTRERAEAAEEAARAWLANAPVRIAYEPQSGWVHRWRLGSSDLAAMLEPTADEDAPVTLGKDALDAWFDGIAPEVEQEAQNAKLAMEDGEVTEFRAGRNGLRIDREKSRDAILAAFAQEEEGPVELAVVKTEPETPIGSLNELGIKEVLGVGTSSYRGSPPNRIKNIRNGVRLLNGLLIAPGETFSLTQALAPFTYDNGYLPELVIKGDKIEPELGGGLCQIGTTTFRTTMNSALPVAERRNHSLVVSYYNDPQNGNPGTDATIYEPAPDYKFTNDTGHHVLFQAEMLEDTQDLRFTFWGTNDGRRGSYTPPVVHNWIPAGAPREIETSDLEPGQRKCQAAHMGANASFTYTLVRPDGEVEETVYDSHYRPLPRICLVGVAEEESEDAEDAPAAQAEPEQTDGEGTEETEDAEDAEGASTTETKNADA